MASYAHACGPRALARLADLSPFGAARVLLVIARASGWRPDKRSTPRAHLLAALEAAGWRSEMVPTGDLYALAFARRWPKGRFLLAVREPGRLAHAVALVDGKLFEAEGHEFAPVLAAYRLTPTRGDG